MQNRSLTTIPAAAGLLLCALLVLDHLFGWGLCGGGGCTDPRWQVYGRFFGLPVSAAGLFAYAAACGILRFKAAGAQGIPAIAPFIIGGAILGAHGYLTWVQAYVIHSWCYLCIATTFCGLVLFCMLLLEVSSASRPLACAAGAVCAILVSTGVLSFAHRNIRVAASPNPLARGNAPALYRPEETINPALSIVERIRASKSEGPAAAAIHIEIFTDPQCSVCADFETTVWPAVLRKVKVSASDVRVTRRLLMLEGHPLGWQAGLSALCAGESGLFAKVQHQLFSHQAEWVRSGDPNGLIAGMPEMAGKLPFSPEVMKAAKAVLSEDVRSAVSLNVKTPPTVVIISPGKKTLLAGLREVDEYCGAIEAAFESVKRR